MLIRYALRKRTPVLPPCAGRGGEPHAHPLPCDGSRSRPAALRRTSSLVTMSSRHLRLLCWPMAGQRLWCAARLWLLFAARADAWRQAAPRRGSARQGRDAGDACVAAARPRQQLGAAAVARGGAGRERHEVLSQAVSSCVQGAALLGLRRLLRATQSAAQTLVLAALGLTLCATQSDGCAAAPRERRGGGPARNPCGLARLRHLASACGVWSRRGGAPFPLSQGAPPVPPQVVRPACSSVHTCLLGHASSCSRPVLTIPVDRCFASWAALGVTIPLMLLPILPALPAYWNFFRCACAPRPTKPARLSRHRLTPCSFASSSGYGPTGKRGSAQRRWTK